jgi:hypothetical protein
MAKSTNPKNTELESDVLKAAGTGTPPPVDQQAIKDQAQTIGDQANKAQDTAPQTIPGIPGNMQGQLAEGVQMPGSNLPPVAKDLPADSTTAEAAGFLIAGKDPEYLEFLEWKKNKAEADKAAADLQAKFPPTEKTTPFEDPDAEIKRINAQKQHEERVKVYGEGYVVAQRQGVVQVFTKTTWNLLGGRKNTDGYTEVVAAPPEVANLKKPQ